ncbi:dipeptide epimerase [Algivirga pacifica]|uniref:Dipeptide epimerase n=1 Tax=Algivirga pacifica TaxID=1162670 RepID=A0ABP9D3K6_9BACT
MKIKAIEYELHNLKLSEPYQIAYETVDSCQNITLKVITDTGLVGYGIAAPDWEVTGEYSEDVISMVKDVMQPMLLGEDPLQRTRWMDELKQTTQVGSSARAMLDLALHDLLGKYAKLPLYKLLGGYKNSIPTSITIGIKPIEETIETAKRYLRSGFTVIKLKGGIDIEEDIEKVHLLREQCGDDFLLRFDANQGYTPEEALTFIRKTDNCAIEIMEQPTHKNSLRAMKVVTDGSDIPVMADESITSLKDAIKLTRNEAMDMINIKLQKVGGILEAEHINSVGKSSGLEVMVGCLDECSLGIAAGLHFALSRPNIQYADLDGHLDIINDPYEGLFEIKNGVMIPNQQYGLGLSI